MPPPTAVGIDPLSADFFQCNTASPPSVYDFVALLVRSPRDGKGSFSNYVCDVGHTFHGTKRTEIPPLVSEYLEWTPKSRKELIQRGSCRLLCTLRRQGDALYPLGKLVDHH